MLTKYIKLICSRNQHIFPSGGFKGTNCFLVGQGGRRILIDGGSYPTVDHTFIPRLQKLLEQEECRIDKIFVTQGVKYHFGGV
jgi:Cft2 family RNA processing exonuclease